MPRHHLRDATWASLLAKLRTIPGIWKRDPEALRGFVEAVGDLLPPGVVWQDLPERFGKPTSIHRRFRRWAAQGIWDELFADGIPTDALETVMLDATICKAQRFASGARGSNEEALGRSRGGLTTKIHRGQRPRSGPPADHRRAGADEGLWSMASAGPCASCSRPGRPPTYVVRNPGQNPG